MQGNGWAVVAFIGASVTTLLDMKRVSLLTGDLDQGTCLLTLFTDASSLSHWIEFEAESEAEEKSFCREILPRWTERSSSGNKEERLLKQQQPFSDVYRLLSYEAEDKESTTTYGQYGITNGTSPRNRWRSTSTYSSVADFSRKVEDISNCIHFVTFKMSTKHWFFYWNVRYSFLGKSVCC